MPLATAARLSPDVPAVDPPARIAVIGAGSFGRFCIDAYAKSEDVEVVAVADPDEAALGKVDKRDVLRETDWRVVIDLPSLDAIHIATPPFARQEIVIAALTAGKSVFCEKPLALTLDDADAMIALAHGRGVALGINYVMRHQPAYHALEVLAGSGIFGRLRTISLENYAQIVPRGHWFWDPARSGGIMVEHGVHFIDTYGRLAGQAQGIWGHIPHPEAIDVTIRYADDIIGRFYHEFAFPRQVERLAGTCFFERGFIVIEGWIPTDLRAEVLADRSDVLSVARSLQLTMTPDGGDVVKLHSSYLDREGAYQRGIVSGMRDVVHYHRDSNYRMVVPISDARDSLALALAAQRAAGTGSTLNIASQGTRVANGAQKSFDELRR